jgi:uncharacterized protein YgiM (DUF1202 family)/uncharacterized membrane protein
VKHYLYFKNLAALALGIGLCILAAPTTAQVDNRQMVTTKVKRGDSLNVRTGPGTQYEDIGDIRRNSAVPVLGYDSTGHWAKVLWRGVEGWVAASYLSGGIGGENLNPANQPQGQVYAQGLGPHVVAGVPANDPNGGLALRNGPGTDFAVTHVIENTADVFVVSYTPDGKWAFIRFSTGTGYVSSQYLQPSTGQGQASNSVGAPDRGVLPAPFTVTNVSANDVLNIRRKPSAGSEILSNFVPNQVVTVLEHTNNGWAKVSVGENVGFVNASFLTRGGGVQTAEGMQLGLSCGGTEPFWTLNIDTNGAIAYDSLVGGAEPVTTLTSVSASPGSNVYPFNFAAAPYSGVLSQQVCSDGMSDIQYGWGLTLIKPNPNGGWVTLNGCCALQ